MRFEKLLLAAAALCLVCMAPACSDDDPATDPEQNRPERRVRGREMEMTTPENPGNPILPTHPH